MEEAYRRIDDTGDKNHTEKTVRQFIKQKMTPELPYKTCAA